MVVHQLSEQFLAVRGYDEVIKSRKQVGINGPDEINSEGV